MRSVFLRERSRSIGSRRWITRWIAENLIDCFRALSIFLLICVGLGPLYAQAPGRTTGQFGQTPASVNVQVGHDSWTFKDGAPADVTCLAQTNDGFLWLGSPAGLFRFDGTRFERFSSPFGDQLLSSKLYSLYAPSSGGLWIGYANGGFSFLDKGRLTNYASETGTVVRFAQDRDGIVWAGTTGGLWRFDHSRWQHLGLEWDSPASHIMDIGLDAEGILWVLVGNFGSSKDLIYLLPGARHFKTAARNLSTEVFTWEPGQTVLTAPAAPGASPAAYPVTAKNLQVVDRNDSVWISPTGKTVVMRVPKERLGDGSNAEPPADSETYDINPYRMAELVDREGNIWFGDSSGLHRLFYTPLIRQELAKDTLGSDFAVVADDNGAVWISFNSGNTLNADLFHVFGSTVEHSPQQVTSSFAYRAPDKTFWFSGKGCLWHLVGKDFVRVDLPPEIVNQSETLQTIAEDHQGGMWVAVGHSSLYRLANGSWIPFGGHNDLSKAGRVMVAFNDRLGRVWFGYMNGQLAVLDGDRVRLFRPGGDLQVGNVTAIYGRGPEIWIGGEFGLEQFDQGHFHKIAALDDQWLHGISGIVETANGDLWLNAISGIFHIRKAEVSQALRDSAYRVKGEHFDRREGLSGIPSQVHPLPTAIEGSDGRLWFTARNEAVWLDPAGHAEKRPVSPPITIQSISADDKFYPPDSGLSLPAHTSSVQISYNAVSLSDPEAIRFRYSLQETDKDWHEVAAATPVTYRNLPPGSYHFTVEASDTNGVWSGAPANMAFTIQPAFYQTIWFRALCVLAFVALLWAVYRMRVHQLQEQEKKFRDAIETMPALAFVVDPNGNRTFFNRGWLEYTGLSSEEASSGWDKAIHPDDLDRINERWLETRTTGQPLDYEGRLRRGSDGVYRWFQTRAQPLRDNRGRIVKWCAVATDIEDRRHAERLQADLTHASRVSTMGELVASISHELAQPITATANNAKASLRWLQRDPPDLTEVRHGTERIIEASNFASQIIDRLRSLYKKASPKRERVAVNEIVTEMAGLLKSEARRHGVSIYTDLQDDLPLTVADRVQIQQVLMNLMLNGIEAITDAGGTVMVKSQLSEDGEIEVSVSDTGRGLPQDGPGQIFDAFFTTKPQGSGMGLAISRSIVESHRGRIWVNGDGGRGATFHFTLPPASAETTASTS